jgi:hypothetical protein
MDKDTHVYCLDCIYYKSMHNLYLNEDHGFSLICSQCDPFDPEDSRAFELRKNYVAIKM